MSSTPNLPRVVDNDRDEITVTLNGKELRGWSYRDEAERRVKILAAREFVEGWYVGSRASAATGLRDEFATHALGFGFDWTNVHETGGYAEAAQVAYEIADAMLAAREASR